MEEVDDTQLSLMSLEEELSCSICLSPFNCPVTIPCGHNFCHDCLQETWRDSYSCPQCRTVFATKPELRKNTVLSSMVETFGLRASRSEGDLPVKESKHEEKDVIRCDTCMMAEASRTCLTCMASFCDEHLRPHRENPNFSLHQLSEPVGDLQERICPDHHKLMEFFCSQHERPICSFCLQQVHKGCTFMSPDEQKNMKEFDFRDKLNLLDGKIEKTQTVLFQMDDMKLKLKDAAAKKKTAIATLYQQVRDLLAQEEREAQLVVEQELEMGQNKLRDLTKKLTANITDLTRAKEQINGLLSESQSMSFLQASFDLPTVVKFEPHLPRVNLDSPKVVASQTFAAELKKNLTEMFQQPVEDRLAKLIRDEKVPPPTGSTGSHPGGDEKGPPPTGSTGSHPGGEPASPGPPHMPPYFQKVPVPVYMGPPVWNQIPFTHSQAAGPYRSAPFPAQHKTKQAKTAPSVPGGSKKSGKGSDSQKTSSPGHQHSAGKSAKSHTQPEQAKKAPSVPGGSKKSGKGSDSQKTSSPGHQHSAGKSAKSHTQHGKTKKA